MRHERQKFINLPWSFRLFGGDLIAFNQMDGKEAGLGGL